MKYRRKLDHYTPEWKNFCDDNNLAYGHNFIPAKIVNYNLFYYSNSYSYWDVRFFEKIHKCCTL